MSRRRAAIGVASLAGLVLLAGCNRQADQLALTWYPPWTLSQSPEGITLRWYRNATSPVTANHVAQRHCRSWARSAELVSDTRDGSADIAQYRCR